MFAYIWIIFRQNLGEYSSTMHMGTANDDKPYIKPSISCISNPSNPTQTMHIKPIKPYANHGDLPSSTTEVSIGRKDSCRIKVDGKTISAVQCEARWMVPEMVQEGLEP